MLEHSRRPIPLPTAKRVGDYEFGCYVTFFMPYITHNFIGRAQMIEIPFVKCLIEALGETAPVEVRWDPEVRNGRMVFYFHELVGREDLPLQFNRDYTMEEITRGDAIRSLEQSVRERYRLQE